MNYLSVIATVLMVVFGFLCAYFRTKTNVITKVSELIAQAEKEFSEITKAGTQKFQFVVDSLYEYIPKILKPLITKEMLGGIVQNTFNAIESYATTQLDKLVDKISE